MNCRIFSLRSSACLLAASLALASAARAEVLTLEDCLRETAAHNATIIAQQFDVQRATGTRLTLRARALPTLTVTGTLGYQGAQNSDEEQVRTRQPNGTTQTTITTSERRAQGIVLGTGNLTQSIFDAAIPASWRRGDVGILAAEQNYYTVAVGGLYQARTQFNRALYYQLRAKVIREMNAVLTANVHSVEALVNAGIDGRQNLLLAQVGRGNFAPAVADAEGTYRSTLAFLLQTMGRQTAMSPGGSDPLTQITVGGHLDETAITFDAETVGKEALARRSDIASLRALTQGYKEDITITQGNYYPRVQVYLAGELLPESFVRSSRPNAIRSTDQVQTTEIRPGGREDWSVIDTGAVYGEAHRLGAVRAELLIGLQKLEANIPSELAGVRATVNGNAATLATLRASVETAHNTLNLVNAGVAQGINSQLEFIDAEVGYLNVELSMLDAAFALTQARTEFDRISGRYLRYVTDDDASKRSRSK